MDWPIEQPGKRSRPAICLRRRNAAHSKGKKKTKTRTRIQASMGSKIEPSKHIIGNRLKVQREAVRSKLDHKVRRPKNHELRKGGI